MSRRICVVTGSRAEYGLLRAVMQGLRDAGSVTLQVVVTGSHLSPAFGDTWREIEADGFDIDRRVDLQLGDDSAAGIGRSMGAGLTGFADAFAGLSPDLVVLLGDRYEILCAAAAALVARVPVAHLHGGEVTEGAFDDAIRHAVTKMAHLHFVAAEPYGRRVRQLGEPADRVFVVGGLGIDAIGRVPRLDRAVLERDLGIVFRGRNLLVTFHPATLDEATAADQIEELLAALAPLDDTTLIFTMPNADPGGLAVRRAIETFVAGHANAAAFASLGQQRYFSCLAQVDGVLGNSSSGLTEAPSFRVATINVGDRQLGRLRAESVIDCDADRGSIAQAIDRSYAPQFRRRLASVRNPYGDGGASDRIVRVLATHALAGLTRKRFVDLACSP